MLLDMDITNAPAATVYLVRHIDSLWYIVDARFPNVLTSLPLDTRDEAQTIAAEWNTRSQRDAMIPVVFTGPIA